jgi:hypothetical protein
VAVAGVVLGVAIVTRSGSDPGSTTQPATPSQTGVFGGTAVPAEVKVEGNTHLKPGGLVKLRVTSKEGAEIYGFEAFLCKNGATFELDADVRPDYTGNCASKPLSADSDRYKQVKATPPYRVVETTFRAGAGSDTYTMIDGNPATVTCGPGNPCQIVLKVQYPNGYGFRAFPLVYS